MREILDRGVAEIAAASPARQAVRGNLMRAMGQAYTGLGLYPKARDLLQEGVAAAEKSGVATDILEAHLALAANRYADGDFAQAQMMYRKALAEARALHAELHPEATQAMNGLAESVYALEKPQEAETLYRRALELDLPSRRP